MKSKHLFRLLALPIASLLSSTAAHSAVVDTTGTTITYTAAQNILNTQVIGNGTLNFDGSGLIGLDNSGGGNPVTLAMTGGNITVQAGVTLQNGGWQGGIWTNNLSSLDLASGATLDVWDGNPVRVDALTGAGNVSISIFPGFGPNWAGNRSLVLGVNGGGGIFTGNISGNSAVDGGSLSLTKEGAGTQTLTGNNTFTGGTTVNGGRLVLVNNKTGSSNFITNSELEFNVTSGTQQLNGGAISGTGNLIKSGAGQLLLGANGSNQTMAMSSGSLIDVQGGLLRNEWGNSAWGGNLADLNVASGAYLDLWDGNITVDAITGSGTINKAWVGTNTLSVGVDNGSGTFSGTISSLASPGGGYSGIGGGTLNLVKQGSGTQTLSGVNTYTGTTSVNQGKLVINGSISSSTLTTVSSGATLGGDGTVGALTVNSGAFVTPGNSSGILTVNGNYTQAGTYSAEIGGIIAGSGHDQIGVTGSVEIAGGSLVTLFSGAGYTVGDMLFILLNDGTDAVIGNYTGFAQGATVATYGGLDWLISYSANGNNVGSPSFTGGNDIALMAIPEPNVAALLGGLGVFALLRRRR